MKCPQCNKQDAILDPKYGVMPCAKCQKSQNATGIKQAPEFALISKHNRIIQQRDAHSKDILQPFDNKGKPSLDFVKAYPNKRGDYFKKEDLKRL